MMTIKTKNEKTSEPDLSLLSDDEAEEALRDTIAATQRDLALELLEKDPEANIGIGLFHAYKGEKEPKGPVNNRRGMEYERRAQRTARLRELTLQMTPFQSRFVQHYCEFKWDSYQDIAIMAGSTAKAGPNARNVAWQTLQNKTVIEAIGLMIDAKMEAEALSRWEIVAMFRDAYSGAYVDKDWKSTIAAAEKLAVVAGYLTPGNLSPLEKRNMTKMEQKQLQEIHDNNAPKATRISESDAQIPQLDEDLKSQVDILRKSLKH